MRFLIDTNVLIPMEPAGIADVEVSTPLALNFANLTNSSGNNILIHPAIIHDFNRDRNRIRAELRNILMQRYPEIQSPPSVDILNPDLVGTPEEGTNNWVDNSLLASVYGNAVDYLITEDGGMHRKASRLGIQDRVLSLADAISLLSALFDRPVTLSRNVENIYVHEISLEDSILNSLRDDYPGFNNWLIGCQRTQRQAFIIRKEESDELAALCIYKREDDALDLERLGLTGRRILKICTLKVSPDCSGNRYGELLFKTVYKYLIENNYDATYFSVFAKQVPLIAFAKSLGFEIRRFRNEELAMVKHVSPSPEDIASLDAYTLHVKYGPGISKFNGNSHFIVPIEPHYHHILFPELNRQGELFPTYEACGNSIKKAYICKSNCRRIQQGDNLLFYRSQDAHSISVLGIVEGVYSSKDPDEIARFVSTRTVYTLDEIRSMCLGKRNPLAINFRLVKYVEPTLQYNDLLKNLTVTGPPQSITQVRNQDAIDWLSGRITF